MSKIAKAVRALVPSAWEVHVTEWNMHSDWWNVTNGAAVTTATWIGLQDDTDLAFLYWGCCAGYPYTGHGSAGNPMALLAADGTQLPKPEALAFSLWHRLVAEFGQRRTVIISGFLDPVGNPYYGG